MFWRQTPRTFVAIMRGRNDASERRHNELMSQAWHTAALPLMRKFPALATLLITHEAEAAPEPGTALAGQLLDAFLMMQAQGSPMTIKRLN